MKNRFGIFDIFTFLSLILILILSTPNFAQAKEKDGTPKDVQQFIEKRDNCDHFLGEEPYDKERQLYLNKMTKQFCTGTDKKLKALKRKYKNNLLIMQKLEVYDPSIEAK